MIKFTTTILKFQKKGEKTGWSYVVIPQKKASQLNPSKVSFRVKGTLDKHPIKSVALLPMGDGEFIIPMNAAIRKATGKTEGDKITVTLELDTKELKLSEDMIACLKAEPDALKFFKSIPPSHQRYFSKWIEDAKTTSTKAKRITITVIAMSKKQTYGEMMRSYRDSADLSS